jgi:tungstate transport system substrate-binding protein
MPELAKRFVGFLFLLAVAGCASSVPLASPATSTAESKDVFLATTTSTQDSGLLDEWAPLYRCC